MELDVCNKSNFQTFIEVKPPLGKKVNLAHDVGDWERCDDS
jgi:hypothetical protein